MSSPVKILDSSVAERIAAGEVIERPASVVKEMVENSLDAGATQVCVALEEGGKTLIEILDNGHGMSREDLSLCVRRHATSKLATIADLEKIRTLGFRGEALPSVAAVSELSILTRQRFTSDPALNSAHSGTNSACADTAWELRLNAVGDDSRVEDRDLTPRATTFGHFLGSSHGTRIQARGLFSQIPARLKFLKSQGAEVAAVREWLERLALSHPECGFRLLSEGRQILNLKPESETDRVRSILADGDDFPVVTAANDLGLPDGHGLHVRVHWLQGLSTPQMRKLVQVVNGRAVRDRMLQQALLAPFRQALLPGQFPAVALFLEVDPSSLDVNVHPTKTEVRFLDSRRVFREIQRTVEDLIAREGAPAYASAHSSEARFYTPPRGPEAPAHEMNRTVTSTLSASESTHSSPTSESPGTFRYEPGFRASEPQNHSSSAGFDYSSPPVFTSSALSPPMRPSDQTPLQFQSAAPSSHPLQGGRYAGALFNTYLLYENGPELILVDQHAAHERIRYEQLKRRAFGLKKDFASQQLLLPEAVRFPTEERASLEGKLDWLSSLGFDAEIFGEESLLFRAVPPEWGTDELRPRLKNLVDRVLEAQPGANGGASVHLDEAIFEKLASEACHSAVRGGDRLDPHIAASIVDQLFGCEHPWNCPHGRPTVVRVPRARFEEWFQRRV